MPTHLAKLRRSVHLSQAKTLNKRLTTPYTTPLGRERAKSRKRMSPPCPGSGRLGSESSQADKADRWRKGGAEISATDCDGAQTGDR